jgi:hypothetical protein
MTNESNRSSKQINGTKAQRKAQTRHCEVVAAVFANSE